MSLFVCELVHVVLKVVCLCPYYDRGYGGPKDSYGVDSGARDYPPPARDPYPSSRDYAPESRGYAAAGYVMSSHLSIWPHRNRSQLYIHSALFISSDQ